jgi:ABC-type sugar transport system permease subunit
VALNINSILLAFQTYDFAKAEYYISGFNNFGDVLRDIFVTGNLMHAVKNSGIQFLVTMFIVTPLNVICAYVVFKKVPFSGFIKVILFMPNMLPAMAFVTNARVLITYGFPEVFGCDFLLNPYDYSSFWTVLIFGSWMSFAGGLVVYLSAMSSISKEMLEYGGLEPLSSLKELVYIIIPSIFPTIVTYIVVTIGGFFINAGHFYSFFGGNATKYTPFDTLGYYFFIKVAGNDAVTGADYTYASAGGILFTLIVAPVTIITKNLLEKYGPCED